MSEFTSGVLFLAKDADIVEAELKKTDLTYLVRPLNERWVVFLPGDMFLMDDATIAVVSRVSTVAPLLYFNNAEDHGWSYRIFSGGSEVDGLSVMYPWGDVLADLWDDEEEEEGEQPGEPAGDVSHSNPEHFRLFGLPDEVISALDRVLVEGQEDEQSPDRVEAFKQALGITEMSWMSYRYASKDE